MYIEGGGRKGGGRTILKVVLYDEMSDYPQRVEVFVLV